MELESIVLNIFVSVIAGLLSSAIFTLFINKNIKGAIVVFVVFTVICFSVISTIKSPIIGDPPPNSDDSQNEDNNERSTINSNTHETGKDIIKPRRTTSIFEMSRIDTNFDYSSPELLQDVHGNEYGEYVNIVPLMFENKRSEEFITDGKYNTFQGELFVWEKSSAKTSYVMKVYTDGRKVYVSPRIKKKSTPCKFSIDISDSDIVKVEFVINEGEAFVGDGEFLE